MTSGWAVLLAVTGGAVGVGWRAVLRPGAWRLQVRAESPRRSLGVVVEMGPGPVDDPAVSAGESRG